MDDGFVVDDVDEAFCAHGGFFQGWVSRPWRRFSPVEVLGDGDREACSLPGLAFDGDSALVLFDDGVADGQPQAGPLADPLVVKKGSKIWGRCCSLMPVPVSAILITASAAVSASSILSVPP